MTLPDLDTGRAGAAAPSHAAAAAPPRADTDETADERARLAARVLLDAVLLGALGDALLRGEGVGVNLTIWAAAIVAALLSLARRRQETLPREAVWLACPAIAIALAFAWRAAEDLAFFNIVGLLGTLALLGAAVSRAPRPLVDARVRDLAASAVSAAAAAAFGMLWLVLGDVSLRDAARSRWGQTGVMVLRASLMALPLLLVFGGLFASADPVFERLVAEAVRIRPEQVVQHLVVTGVLTWLVGGFLRGALLARGPSWPVVPGPTASLGVVEIAVPLGALTVLFLAFVLVQLRYFFGGEALVQATAGLGYAEYARRGFFELVAVSVLVLPLLLGAHALLRPGDRGAERTYRALAGALLVLLGVIMYSALARMRLYQQAYGLTTDRLYATVFMGWLAVVFAWFAVTVLRRRARHFAVGAVLAAWGTLASLNVLDPTGYAARTNVARARAGHGFDLPYATRMGADAVPAVVDYLLDPPTAPVAPERAGVPNADDRTGAASQPDDFRRCDAARVLLERWADGAPGDWRAWNLGRARARAAVAAREPALRALACPPRQPPVTPRPT